MEPRHETAPEGPLRPVSLTFPLVEKDTEAESKTKIVLSRSGQASSWEPVLAPFSISSQFPILAKNTKHYS